MADEWYNIPNGVNVVTRVGYTHAESRGPLALAVTAGISLCAVIAILIAMTISGFKTRHQFVRSQVGAYFLSLVLSDLVQATGSVMNAKWVVIQGVTTGPFCSLQAALKQGGNVGTALWSLVISIHTFCLLFLRLRIGDHVFYSVLVGVWVLIGFVALLGPVILQRSEKGPFWGISGYWCWITDGYHVEQFTNEYLFMFSTAVISFVLYSLIFFRLRGNLHGAGWSLKFRRVREPWKEDRADESQMSTVGKQMLWYPVAYTVIILPIAACRWSAIFGHEVPYGATMAADSIFMLSGFVNAILYSATRKIVSVRTLLPLSYLVRIGPSWRADVHDLTSSKPSLEDMEFATPISPAPGVKWDPQHSSPSPISPLRLWRPLMGTLSEFSQSRGGHNSSPETYKVEMVNDQSETGHTSDSHVFTEERTVVKEQRRPSVSALVTHKQPPDIEGDVGCLFQQTIPETSTGVRSPLRDAHRVPSESSMSTDGAPSLHRKRFSGWSLPSVRGVTSQEDDEGGQTELEEMQFASPSPERRFKTLPPSRPASTGDVPLFKWPPRAESLR